MNGKFSVRTFMKVCKKNVFCGFGVKMCFRSFVIFRVWQNDICFKFVTCELFSDIIDIKPF